MKLMTVVGTRPEIIRLSRVLVRADDAFDHVLVHTGQNWDRALSSIFFEELELRNPDVMLSTDTSSLGAFLGSSITTIDECLQKVRPDAFLVLGDTNSALTSIMAKRHRIPVYHMEAGNRSFDGNVPEEINRRIVDHTADFNLAYTEHARRNLLAEGLHPRRVYVTGSPMREVLTHYLPRIEASTALTAVGCEGGDYYLVSVHREENVDNPRRLAGLLDGLDALAEATGRRVIVSTHPRTRLQMERLSRSPHAGVVFAPPFGFLDYVHLQMHAARVLSDSGTISEEAAILGFPGLTLRPAIERPEALDTGSVRTVAPTAEAIVAAVQATSAVPAAPVDYCIPDTSARVVNLIASTAPFHREWSGLRPVEAAGTTAVEGP